MNYHYYALLQFHYYTIITPLLHHYHIIITSLLLIITHYYDLIIKYYNVIITSLLRHYYIIITSLFRNYYSLLQFHYFLFLRHYYVTITSLLRRYYVIIIHYYSLLQFHYYLLLRHYYVIITSLLRHYYKWRNFVIMSLLLPIFTLAVSIIMPLLPIITIITYYYVFETGKLADDDLRHYLGLNSVHNTSILVRSGQQHQVVPRTDFTSRSMRSLCITYAALFAARRSKSSILPHDHSKKNIRIWNMKYLFHLPFRHSWFESKKKLFWFLISGAGRAAAPRHSKRASLII